MKRFKSFSIGYLIWMIIFTGIPLILMVLFSVSDIEVFNIHINLNDAHFTLEHFPLAFGSSFIVTFGRSIKLALIATIGTILIGYPVAYIIAKSHFRNKYLILLAFILPMWTNMLLRIQTINDLLKPEGFMKNVFGFSFNLSGTEIAVIIVMILVYLPFMIFPIFTVLEKMDKSLIEASMDLGASPIKTFFTVTIPLSLKGVTSGIMMVFLPCAMGFTIPYIVSNGNPDLYLIGQLIERYFQSSYVQYNVGCVTALLIVVIVLGSLFLLSRIDEEGETLL